MNLIKICLVLFLAIGLFACQTEQEDKKDIFNKYPNGEVYQVYSESSDKDIYLIKDNNKIVVVITSVTLQPEYIENFVRVYYSDLLLNDENFIKKDSLKIK